MSLESESSATKEPPLLLPLPQDPKDKSPSLSIPTQPSPDPARAARVTSPEAVKSVVVIPPLAVNSPVSVVFPVTSRSPLKVVFPDAANVVNAPDAAVVDPIEVASISPPSISTVDKVEVPLETLRSAPIVKSLSNSAIPLIVTLSSAVPRTI